MFVSMTTFFVQLLHIILARYELYQAQIWWVPFLVTADTRQRTPRSASSGLFEWAVPVCCESFLDCGQVT
ncbi:hypothetical protein SCOR_06565 [Sulfidibacter corallicola]